MRLVVTLLEAVLEAVEVEEGVCEGVEVALLLAVDEGLPVLDAVLDAVTVPVVEALAVALPVAVMVPLPLADAVMDGVASCS